MNATKISKCSLPPPAPQFAKAKKVAERVGVCSKTIHRWAAAGHFTARKVTPRVVVYDLEEVLRFVESGRVA